MKSQENIVIRSTNQGNNIKGVDINRKLKA